MNPAFPVTQISVEDLAVVLQHYEDEPGNRPVQLIDVREPMEVAIAQLPGFAVYPFSEYAEWSDQLPAQLDTSLETIVLCHHGIRSAQMCQWLLQQGFQNVKNVAGGIDAYAVMVDRSLARY